MVNYLWLIPLLPLMGAVVNGVFGKRLSKGVIGLVAMGTVLLSFAISAGAWLQMMGMSEEQLPILRNYFSWIQSGSFEAHFGFQLDHLSGLMILIVTGVGFLIHVYSTAYMADEPRGGFARFFCYLNLFCFFMLMLVLGNNFLVMFVGWEGVGLCSYLLIGYWYEKKSASDAGKKAFITNRVGDWGFVLGVFLIYSTFGTLDFRAYVAALKAGAKIDINQALVDKKAN